MHLMLKFHRYPPEIHRALPRRAFAPRNPSDLRLGYSIKFTRPGGKISRGTVKYVGHLPGRSEVFVGVESDDIGRYIGNCLLKSHGFTHTFPLIARQNLTWYGNDPYQIVTGEKKILQSGVLRAKKANYIYAIEHVFHYTCGSTVAANSVRCVVVPPQASQTRQCRHRMTYFNSVKDQP